MTPKTETKILFKKFIHSIKKLPFLLWKASYKVRTTISFYRFSRQIYSSEFKKHTLITWMTWSGKSELLKYLTHYQISRNKSSVIVIDPHWDVANEIVNNRYLDQKRVVYFSPKLLKKWIFGLNPFALNLSQSEVDIYSNELALVFEEMIKSSSSLTLNMKSLLVPCIEVLLNRKNSSLRDLLRFMLEDNADLVELGKRSKNPSVSEFFNNQFHSPIYSITKQSIAVKIQSLLNSFVFTKITNVNKTIEIKSLILKKKIIVFNLSKWMLWSDVSMALGRFVVALIQSIVINRANKQMKFRMPAYLFIDEFQNYTTKSIKSILEESRKYWLHLSLASQMLWKNIDPVLKETITSNTNVKMIWANSHTQNAYFAKETGIDKTALQRLNVWSFYITSRFTKDFRFKVPKLFLWDRYKMSDEMYKNFEQQQLKRYYKQKSLTLPKFLKPLFDIE